MTVSMGRAWFVGFGILVFVFGLWILFLQLEKISEELILFMHAVPFVAAFVSAYLAPRNKIFLGASMAIPWALLFVALNTIDQLVGIKVDFPGVRGGVILVTVTLIYSAIVGALGAIGGSFLAKKFRRSGDSLSL